MAKVGLFLGHSILKSGAITSADGTKQGGCNEYNYNKQLIKLVKHYLECEKGHDTDVIICPERTFAIKSEERTYKVPKANKGGYDLIVELHLNASSNSQANGAEVLYYTNSAKGRKAAQCVQNELIKVFRDRKIKPRNDLYFLGATNPIAIMIESFFCTCPEDYKKADTSVERDKLAQLIANGIHNYLVS